MTRNEFLILREIEKSKKIDKNKISEITNFSVEEISTIINDLIDKELVVYNKITDKGLKLLEPYRVKRVIFLAAGFGERMLPVTLDIPKPLIPVNGKRIIETLLDAVKEAEIEEIIIVVGYLSEEFLILKEKYPNIEFIYNPKYSEENNISSVYLVKDKLSSSYVFESDMYLNKMDLINKYEFSCNYALKKVDETPDWCVKVTNSIISKFEQGGRDCYQIYGMAYFDTESGKRFEQDIEYVYNNIPGARKRLWDFVHLDYCKENYQFSIKECQEGDIVEIDSFSELKEYDSSYFDYEEKHKKIKRK